MAVRQAARLSSDADRYGGRQHDAGDEGGPACARRSRPARSSGWRCPAAGWCGGAKTAIPPRSSSVWRAPRKGAESFGPAGFPRHDVGGRGASAPSSAAKPDPRPESGPVTGRSTSPAPDLRRTDHHGPRLAAAHPAPAITAIEMLVRLDAAAASEPGGVGLGAFVNLPAGPFVPVAAGAAGPHDPPGPVRRPILAAVPVVLVVGDQSHRASVSVRSRSSEALLGSLVLGVAEPEPAWGGVESRSGA